jgi:hypothetical protein
MNEPSGKIARDASGTGNDGTYHGVFSVQGISSLASDRAVALAGDNGYVSMPDVAPLQGSNDRTVEFWFKTIQTDERNIFHAGRPEHANAFDIGLVGPNGPGGAGSEPSAGLYVHFFDNDIHLPHLQLATGDWHYVAVTVSSGGRQVTVQVDEEQPSGHIWNGSGYEVGIQPQPFRMPWTIDTAAGACSLGTSNRLSAEQGGSVHIPGITGSVDEFAIYPRSLTSHQLSAHYRSALR